MTHDPKPTLPPESSRESRASSGSEYQDSGAEGGLGSAFEEILPPQSSPESLFEDLMEKAAESPKELAVSHAISDADPESSSEPPPNTRSKWGQADATFKLKNLEHLERRRPSFMPPTDTIAGRLSTPPERAQRLVELETAVAQQERQIEGLLKIAESLRQSTKPEEAMKSIVVQISRLLDADRTTIYEMSEDGSTLNGLAVQGDISIEVMIESGRGLAGLVARERRVINLQDAYDHPSFDQRVDILQTPRAPVYE